MFYHSYSFADHVCLTVMKYIHEFHTNESKPSVKTVKKSK